MKDKQFKKYLFRTISGITAGVAGIYLGSLAVYYYTIVFNEKNKSKGISRSIKENLPAANHWYQNQSKADWNITSQDGLMLHGTFIESATPTNKVAILAHGIHHSHEQMAGYAEMFNQLGYSVLMPDARGHGKSQGELIGMGWLDRFDYVDWINKVINKRGDDVEIVLFGISMGAATVMSTSGELLPANVKAVIEDSGYAHVFEESKYRTYNKYKVIPVPTVAIVSQYTKYFAGYALTDGDVAKQVSKSGLPMLFIHGEADQTVPVANIYELYHAATGPKKLYIDPTAGHIQAINEHPERYHAAVADFLTQYVK